MILIPVCTGDHAVVVRAAAAQPGPVGVPRAAAATLQAGVSDVRTRKSV